jgi:hypothetical protein
MLCQGPCSLGGHELPGEGARECQRTKTPKTPFSRLALIDACDSGEQRRCTDAGAGGGGSLVDEGPRHADGGRQSRG